MKKILLFCSAAVLLASCGTRTQTADTEPDVAITRISGPLLATQQAPESGGAGGGSAGTSYDPSELLNPGGGPITVAASTLYDPVTGQTSDNPLSVYVVASDEKNITQVELYQDGLLVGTRSKAEDGIAFRNPFIFPKPGSSQTSVQLQGTSSGMLSTQLMAVATDSSGQTKESAPLELQIDGSRPNLSVSVSGSNGAPYLSTDLITLTGSASDPETGIESFDVTLNGTSVATDASNSFTTTETLEAGTYTLVLTAVNGVSVPNQVTSMFQVTEAPSGDDGSDDGDDGTDGGTDGGTSNQAPTVSLLASPLSGDAPLNVSFTASANDLDGDEVSYLYSFGDGETTAGAPAASHTYTEDGTYTAEVTVADGKGGTASDSAEIIVGDGDNGDDNGDDGGGDDGGSDDGGDDNGDNGDNDGNVAAPDITSFTTSDTSVSSGDSVTLSWEITGETTEVTITPDGSAVTGTSKIVTPTETTTYVITATNGEGTDTEEVTVTVGDDDGGDDGNDDGQIPVVSIDGDNPRSVTVNEAQELEASSSNLGDNPTYQWSVTDGNAEAVSFTDATSEDTTATFETTGSYTLMLSASSAKGTVTDTLTVTANEASSGGGDGDDGDQDDDNGGVHARDDRKGTTRNQAVTLNVLGNDEPSVQALTVIAATAPRRGGRIEITRDSRNIVYTPPEGFTGTDTFKYTVSDGDDHTSRAVVTIVVR